jgi:hypothetical protein
MATRAPKELEDPWQETVIELAQLTGWIVAHFRPAQTAKGWRTAVSADGKGFLDLVMVRERVIYAEIKSETGKLTPDERKWMTALSQAGQEVYVWRPSDYDRIVEILKRKRADGPVTLF